MKLSLLALALLMSCSACAPTRVVVPLKPDPERLDCVELAGRPTIPAEYVVDWTRIRAGGDAARDEVTRLIASVRSREGIVVGYVVQLEERVFACSNDATWLRDFYRPLPDG